MPETTITIDRDERDGLYELVRDHLSGIEDFWVALARTKDFATAERLGLEFAEDFRLLQDIGWSEEGSGEAFELTMPPDDLTELLQRLRDDAVSILLESGTEAEASREEAENKMQIQLGFEACEKVLGDLDRRGPRGRQSETREA